MTATGRSPAISVVIPTYNRREVLEKALAAWECQLPVDLPFEVVVVDDGSSDGTAALLEAVARSRFGLVHLAQPNSGPAAARNRALAAAAGSYVLFSGDDIEPAPDLLSRHLEAHRRLSDDRCAVLGRIDWAPDLPLTSTMKHVNGVGAQQFSFHHMNDGDEYDFRHFYTSNVSVSRSLVSLEPTGFSVDFALAAFEDAEFAYRLRRHGLRIVYQSCALAWHRHPYTVESFFRRQLACGRMAAVLSQKWPAVGSLIGADKLRKHRLRAGFLFGNRRRKVRVIDSRLPEAERLAIDVASRFDIPPTASIDPMLLRLFQYAYFKGMAEAVFSGATAKRMAAMSFLDLVVDGGRIVRERLPPQQHDSVKVLLDELTALAG